MIKARFVPGAATCVNAERDTAPGADVWDLATVPELGRVVSGCRLIDRNALMAAASVSEVDVHGEVMRGSSRWDCDETLLDGIDGVWEMRWLISIERDRSGALGRTIDERRYEFFGAPADEGPHLGHAAREWARELAAPRTVPRLSRDRCRHLRRR